MTDHYVVDDLPKPAGAYSHAVSAGPMTWTSGFGPQHPRTGEIPEGIIQQTEQVIDNIEAALGLAGLTLADVVKTTVFLQHLQRDFADYNSAYERRFVRPYPVRTTVGAELMGILVEIDVVAIQEQSALRA